MENNRRQIPKYVSSAQDTKWYFALKNNITNEASTFLIYTAKSHSDHLYFNKWGGV